mmetsp:Transcript_3662/g.6996  ORF Transcript_3662/g.6996 Transcript_3662/m.6996 type:complete len:216 (-) Transcript_3662:367-1014(-)
MISLHPPVELSNVAQRMLTRATTPSWTPVMERASPGLFRIALSFAMKPRPKKTACKTPKQSPQEKPVPPPSSRKPTPMIASMAENHEAGFFFSTEPRERTNRSINGTTITAREHRNAPLFASVIPKATAWDKYPSVTGIPAMSPPRKTSGLFLAFHTAGANADVAMENRIAAAREAGMTSCSHLTLPKFVPQIAAITRINPLGHKNSHVCHLGVS